jgi:hypothetical protein
MTHPLRLVVLAVLSALALAGCFDTSDDGPGGGSPAASPASSSAIGAPGAGSSGEEATGNAVPKITGTPAGEIPAGFPYVFRPFATDADGDALRFQIIGQPAWVSFDPATGELRGVPGETDVGVAAGITIVASDGRGASATLGPFEIRVNRGSAITGLASVGTRPPVISGSPPQTVVAGAGYSFQVVASDPDGDRLVFGALNLPSWLGINSANGTLTGTPGAAHAGTYANIVISVTDGRNTASLPAFTIVVTPPPAAAPPAATTSGAATAGSGSPLTTNGTATLRWVPPTVNADGSPLTDLAGFVVRYGRDPSDLSQQVSLPSPTTTSYTVANLTSGTWYFGVASFTAAGIASDVSAVVSKSFP